MRVSESVKIYTNESPIDDKLWPKNQADSVSETPDEGVTNEVTLESKYPIHESVFGPIGRDIEITDPLDHGKTAIERSEFVPPPTPEHKGSWTGFGGDPSIKDIRERRGEKIPTPEPEQPDLTRILDGKTERQDLSTPSEQQPQTPEGALSQNAENPQLEERALDESEKVGNIDLSDTSTEAASRSERINSLGSVLSSKGREFFKNMPENAKNIASQMYDGIYSIPGVNRAAARAETTWNQFWINRKQDRVIELNDKVREISRDEAILNESEAALAEALEDVRSAGFGSTAKIEKGLRQIASRKIELGEKKTKYEEKVRRKQESMTSFVEKRNEITDRMVSKYEERMRPLETKMENLSGLQDAIEFQITVMKVDHEEKMLEIAALSDRRTKVYEALRSAGQLDTNGNHPALRPFDDVINAAKIKIAKAEAKANAKKQPIESKINKTKAKAEIYSARKREFTAIKERKLYVSETTSPTRSQENVGLEETRLESGFAEEENLAESSRLSIGTFLDKWNEYLTDSVRDEKQRTSLTIDKTEFLRGARWNDSKELDYEHFVKVVEGYYRIRKVAFKDKAEMSAKFKAAKIDNK